jgi:transposase-like protein
MTAAIKAVQEGQSISQAARDHGVPKTMLYDRVSGRVTHGTNPGPNLTLIAKRKRSLVCT